MLLEQDHCHAATNSVSDNMAASRVPRRCTVWQQSMCCSAIPPAPPSVAVASLPRTWFAVAPPCPALALAIAVVDAGLERLGGSSPAHITTNNQVGYWSSMVGVLLLAWCCLLAAGSRHLAVDMLGLRRGLCKGLLCFSCCCRSDLPFQCIPFQSICAVLALQQQ
jgi:hypothetical protein